MVIVSRQDLGLWDPFQMMVILTTSYVVVEPPYLGGVFLFLFLATEKLKDICSWTWGFPVLSHNKYTTPGKLKFWTQKLVV